MAMVIRRKTSRDLFSNVTLKHGSRKDDGKSSFTCPECGKERTFNWKAFSKANEALNARSPFEDNLRKLFELTFPMMRIETQVMGKRMKIYLEYFLDFHCSRCNTPYRLVFSMVENMSGEPCYMIKWVLVAEKETIDLTELDKHKPQSDS